MSNTPVKIPKVITSNDHTKSLLRKLQDLYRGNELTDTTLIAGTDKVTAKAHRVVLSAASGYFLEIFSNSMNEATAGTVELPNVNGSTLRSILDFMYTAELKLCSDTFESVLRAADLLQMSILIGICCDFMIEQLDPCNCLGVTLFAEEYGYTQLYEKSFEFAAKNFEKVCTEQEFLRLDESHLNKLLSTNYLHVGSQETLFLSLVEWFEHDKVSRECLIASLLFQHVRHALLEPKVILENRSNLSNVPKCSELMFDWLYWHMTSEKKKPEQTKKIVYMLELNGLNCFEVQTYNMELNEWSKETWPKPSKGRTEYSTFILSKKLIITGGDIKGRTTNTVEYLDLQSKEWCELPSMETKRTFPGMTEINGNLYVVGGWKGGYWLSSVEKYDFKTHKWQTLASLPSAVADPRTAVLNGLLYVVGSGQYHLDCYNPATNQWTKTASNTERSSHFGMTSLNGYLYTIGGYNNAGLSKTVERYDPSNNNWTVMESLKEGRSCISCTAWNGRLYACGGLDNNHKLSYTFEEYNPLTNEWKSLASILAYKAVFSNTPQLWLL